MRKTCMFCMFVSILVCLSYAPFLKAQKIIHGYIRNIKTNEVLPNANIQIVGTYSGTISNDNGEYILELKQLPAEVLVRYIGYISKSIIITESSPDERHILLEPTVIKFKPIVVTGEDPAVRIMREVIKRKQEWRNNMNTYKAEAYVRFVLENDTSIACIAESTSEIFWDREKGQREIIKSGRQTLNISSMSSIPSTVFLVNLYDDDIDILNFKMVGPTHPKAFRFYNFKLESERSLNDKSIFDISVTPKSKLQPCFIGRISILDKEFALIDVDLKQNESVIFPPPIQGLDFYFKQQFSDFGQRFWLPVDIRIGGDFKIGMTGLEMPNIKYNIISRFTNYQINVQLPDSLYEEKKGLFVDSRSVKKDTLLSSSPSIVPLTHRETEAYKTLDSTKTLDKAFKPKGFLARFVKVTGENNNSKNQNNQKSRKSQKKNISKAFSNIKPQIWYNRVDALHFGLKYIKRLNKRIIMNMLGAYKTGLERWAYGSGLEYFWGKRKNGFINVSYSTGTYMRYHSDHYPEILNSFSTLLGFCDYFDYYWAKKFVAEIGYNINKMKTKVTLGFHDEDHTSVNKSTDYNLLERDYVQRINPAIQEGRLRSLKFVLTFGDKFIPWGVMGQKRAEFRLEHSSPDFLSSDFSFTRYHLTIDWHFATFFKRRFMPNTLDFRLIAGTSEGILPIQRFGSIDVSMGIYSPFGVFKSLAGQPIEGEKYLGLFWEHNFGTIPFELLSLRWLVKKNIGIILHGASGRTWISNKRRKTINYNIRYTDDFYHEIGLSINHLFWFFRLDGTKSLTDNKYYISLSLARWF